MTINRERIQRILAKTTLDEHISEKSLFAVWYDVFAGGASTFSRQDPRRRRSCTSRQLPPRTYYFNYDKNLVHELFNSQNSYTFSGHSYDASTETNFDETDYYSHYLNMQRLFEKMEYLIDMTMERPHENIDSSPFNEQRIRRDERVYFDNDDAKQRLMNNDAVMNQGEDLGGTIPDDSYGLMTWAIPSYYVTTTTGHVSDPPNDGNSGIHPRSNTSNATTPNVVERL